MRRRLWLCPYPGSSYPYRPRNRQTDYDHDHDLLRKKSAAEPQFVLRKDSSRGGWYLEHSTAAKNPTFVNGAPAAAEATKLAPLNVVSIGPDKMRLEVSFS
jgi:hypothetical protein